MKGNDMRTLIVYYSRTGITEAVASTIAELLDGDMEKIEDTKNRDGAMRFIVACKDGVMKKTAEIKPVDHDPAGYDMVIIGSPVWANTMTPAIRRFLSDYGKSIRKAATFVTTNTSGIESTNKAMEELIEGEVVASAGFLRKHVKRETAEITSFVEKLRG